MISLRRPVLAGTVVACLTLGMMAERAAEACPFCAAVSLTFSEEIGSSNAAVIARLTRLPAVLKKQTGDALGPLDDSARAKFEIIEVLKGGDALGETRQIETVYFGDAQVGATFLIMGVDGPPLNWSTPIALSERGRKYIAEILKLPKEGPERMVFFQDYLEDAEEMLARDAYDEFAKTPYDGVKALKPHMKHDQILKWIKDTKIPVSRRRLYLTMLGIYGSRDDIPVLEAMIRSDDRQTKAGLDALSAAYLTLRGPDGMELLEDLFLKNSEAEYTETYAVIMALRFHGQEEKIIPRARLLAGLRTILDRPQLADLVIPDLARWEDWSAMDRLVTLFKNADDESSWVRVPVINYLRACPLPKAKAYLEDLAKVDPDAVKRASSLFPFGAAPAGTASRADKDKQKQKDKEQSQQTSPVEKTKVPQDERTSFKPAPKEVEAAAPVLASAGGPHDVRWQVAMAIAAASLVLLLVFLVILRGGRHAPA